MMKKEEVLLNLNGISQEFQQKKETIKVLDNINLTIKQQEFVCIIGPSGCGKSTLLKIIAGYLKPTSGTCKMHDQLITGPDANRGVVFQSPTLYPWLSVKQNIEYGLKMKKLTQDLIAKKSQSYMEKIQLTGFAEAHTYELSGGMKQRVALARTLINEPELVLMDEPFSALDAITRNTMQVLMRTLWSDSKQTVFLITHDIEEALKLGTRIIVMGKESGNVLVEKKINFSQKILSDKTYNIDEDPKFLADKMELFQLIS